MEKFTPEIIELLKFLSPGFVVALLFYSFTPSFRKKTEFELVIIALLCTIIVNVIVNFVNYMLVDVLGKKLFYLGEWTDDVRILWSFFIAFILSVLLSYMFKNNFPHKLLQKLHLTNQSIYPVGFYSAFNGKNSYIILHLKDGRMLLGWPFGWPNSQENGYFILQDASWLIKENNKYIEESTQERILIGASEIFMVEFIKPNTEEVKDEDKKNTITTDI